MSIRRKVFKNYWPISYSLQFIWLTPNNWICHLSWGNQEGSNYQGMGKMCKNVFNKHNSNILQITLFSLIIHFFIPLFNFVHLFVGSFIHSFISFIYQVLTQLSCHKTDNTKKPNNTSNKGQLYKHFMNTIVYIFFFK